VTSTDHRCFEQLAEGLDGRLPRGPRHAVLGSTDFWHPDSECTCKEVGRLLAELPSLVLLTGGRGHVGGAWIQHVHARRDGAGCPPSSAGVPDGVGIINLAIQLTMRAMR
jgi:hypothetical protein